MAFALRLLIALVLVLNPCEGWRGIAQADTSDCLAPLKKRLTSKFLKTPRPFDVSFGLEIEANFLENPNIVLDYRPMKYSEKQWLGFPYKKRLALARQWEKDNRNSYGTRTLKKLAGADGRLPATLETEVDARVEFNGLVFGDLSAVKKFTNYFVERYGRASFQGHVAFSSQPLPGAAGYAIFEADRAQLAALERGFAQYAKNPSRVPGSNLTHHSLGPLSDVAGSRYRKSERLIGEGKLIGDPGSERRIYGPAFRGDSYPKGKVGYELRQFHKRHEELLSEMGSLSEQVQAPGGLERYKFYDAVELIHWDLPKTRAKELGVEVAPIWNYFVGDLGGQMRGTGPKFFGGTTSSERFYFPLRNWAKNPVIEALPAAERKAAKVRIEKATRKYIEAINAIAVKNKVSAEVVKNVQILNAQWADEVKLSQYFERFRATSQF